MPRPPKAVHARVSRTVAASPDAVYAFLADLRNHWRIASGVVSIVELEGGSDADGGRIELHGPLGLRRTARTRIARAVEPAGGVGGVIEGTAETDGGTFVRVAWDVASAPAGTRVSLDLTVERASAVDRILLALGARRWLEVRLLRRALADLAEHVAQRR